MNLSEEELELAGLLEGLRRVDEATAPSFQQVLGRVREETAPPRRRAVLWVAVAAAVLIAIGAARLVLRGPAPEVGPQAAASNLSRWKAPTDSLLHTPVAELFHATPDVAPPVPDYSWLTREVPDKRTPRVSP